VQEGIKYPPPSSGSEPIGADDLQDDIIQEVRDLFVQDTVEER
jgi:hypothetical protein